MDTKNNPKIDATSSVSNVESDQQNKTSLSVKSIRNIGDESKSHIKISTNDPDYGNKFKDTGNIVNHIASDKKKSHSKNLLQ